jgi:serine/threonine-protein kinase
VRAPVAEGDVLDGKYRVEKVLGVGGMGVVVQAFHEKLEQRVAIKFLLPNMLQNSDLVSRFAREARAAARIKGDHVARVIDVSTLDSGAPYMVMEFLEGQDLKQVLAAHGPFPVQALADYMLEALEGLAEAHRAGIVHRDLKPANLFLANLSDGRTSVKVLDFGISKLQNDINDPSTTSSVAMLGSPIYMSPEQVRLSRAVDHRADIWSVGATMYELATGQRPFPREAIAQMVTAILFDPVPPPSSIRPGLPPAFEAVIVRCLEKEPAARFADCGDLATALAPFASPEAAQAVPRIVRLTGSASARAVKPPEVEAALNRTDPGTPAPVQSTYATTKEPGVAVPATAIAIAVGVGAAIAFVAVAAVGYRYLAAPHPQVAAAQSSTTAAQGAPPPSTLPSLPSAAPSVVAAPVAPAPVDPVALPPATASAPPPADVTPIASARVVDVPAQPAAATPAPARPVAAAKPASAPPATPAAARPKPPPPPSNGFGPRD